MVDNKKILLHKAEMAEHANGAAQFLQPKNRRMLRCIVGDI